MLQKNRKAFSGISYVHGAAGMLAAGIVWWLIPGETFSLAPLMGGVITLMAVWWVFEVIPIAVTSLFPLFLLPAFGVADMKTTAAYYGRPIIFLFLGGFLLAFGLQESGIHKRIALHIVRIIGSNPRRLVLGFMISAGFLSMWISNTASVMVMLPIALAILKETGDTVSGPDAKKLGLSIMLGIAYAADIGGMATVIGTPPNLVFLEMFTDLFPEGPQIGFLQWMAMGLPISLLFMGTGWLVLTYFLFPIQESKIFGGKSAIRNQIQALGRIRRDEIFAGSIFLLAAILWMTGSDLQLFEDFTIPGWRSLFHLPEVSDAAVAIGAASLLFLIPSQDREGQRLLEWESARRIPWGILLLFGGGFAIAGGFELSGLSDLTGEAFANLDVHSPVMLVAVINTVLTFLTEFTSNTAMTNLVLPVLGKAAVALEVDPRLLMIPATLSASCAFMMPIASPTQAIVFGSGYVSIKEMIKAGIWFNLLGIIIVTLLFFLIGTTVLGIDPAVLPEWATK
jgi:sodium-dependent dicarboxylate transporter 2/3/5